MFVSINQPSVVALLSGIATLSYGQLMNNELVPSTLNPREPEATRRPQYAPDACPDDT